MTGFGWHSDGKFGKNYRLCGRSDFLKVCRGQESIRVKGRYCRISSAEATIGDTRFGIAVSRKAGAAVTRNRKKRIIREFLRNNKTLWPSAKMIVITIDSPCDDESGLLNEIEQLLRKIK